MTYNPRRQAMPPHLNSRPLPKNPPRITAWDVLGLVGLAALGAWFLYQFAAAMLLVTYAGASR